MLKETLMVSLAGSVGGIGTIGIVILAVCIHSNFVEKQERRKANEKIKGTFEIFNSKKWRKQVPKNSLFYSVEEVSIKLAKILEEKVYLEPYEIEKINKRIINLNELVDKEFENEIEIKAIEEAIKEFQIEISVGSTFIEHNKKIEAELKKISKFQYKGFVEKRDEKISEIKRKLRRKNPEMYEYIKTIENYNKMTFLSLNTEHEIDKQLDAIAAFYSNVEKEKLEEEQIKARMEKVKNYAKK